MQPHPPTGLPADLFQALVENSSDATALLDAAAVVQYASKSSAQILGYEPEELVGRNALELVHPDDLPSAQRALADCLRRPGTPVESEIRVRQRDGTWRPVAAVIVNRLAERAVAGIVASYRDVTKGWRAIDALRTSEEQLRRFVESAQDLIYYCDTNGRFTYVNPTATRVMKYDESELVGRHFLKLIHKDYRRRAGQLYLNQLVERLPNTYFEFPAITKFGEEVWVGQHVQLVLRGEDIVGVQAIARDITPQKDAEAKLRRSAARYRALIHGAPYGIFRSNHQGQLLDANPALVQMLGFDSIDELMQQNMTEIYRHPTERAQIIERLRRDGETMTPVEVEWKRKDGTIFVVRLSGRVVEFDDGIQSFEGIAEDITERRALEERLREAQKMEAVGRLARGIAHDFNNVLAAIMGCSDLLVLRLPPDDPSTKDAEEIQKAAERAAGLTRQLLAFSRGQAQEQQVIELHEAVSGLDAMLRRLTGGNFDLVVDNSGPPLPVRAEAGQIEQIVLNLVVNARDAMPDGGTITVRTDAIDLGRSDLKYPSMPPGAYARIEVRDTGVGIEPALQKHVFEPFFTTKDASKGTGLGLSIVYGIAKELGGTVSLASVPNQGTQFEVLLPLVS